MGSTLEHGIYLPSEGEKNCYQGLASNWNKVDGALGDVAELKQLIENKFTKEIVTELPTEDINPYCIYMILKTDPETNNIYDEWVYINNAWEYLGNTQVDMTQYYTKQEVNELPAVASGVTSTKVGNYDTHIADTNIHVTANDKTKWNTVALIKQLRLVNTQVGSATTIAFADIDDTNGIKVGDKCMDLDAKMFEITAVDTANQTVTVGTALIDLALDANVVHTSGDESISGDKVFNNRLIKNIDVVMGISPSSTKYSTIDIADNNKASLAQFMCGVYNNGQTYGRLFIQNKTASDGTGLSPTGTLIGCGFNISLPADSTSDGRGSITPRGNKTTDFGLVSYQWRRIWCEQLFLNGTQLDPSAFALDNAVVHLSGGETIGGEKTFTSVIKGYNSDSTQNTVSIDLRTSKVARGSTSDGTENFGIGFRDKANVALASISCIKRSTGGISEYHTIYSTDSDNNVLSESLSFNLGKDGTCTFRAETNNKIILGTSSNRWRDVQTNQINGLTPSSLGMPNVNSFVDISGYFTNTGTGEINTYPVTANGWIYLRLSNISGCQAEVYDSSNNRLYATSISGSIEQIMIPVVSGVTFKTQWATGSAVTVNIARFIPCQGNI